MKNLIPSNSKKNVIIKTPIIKKNPIKTSIIKESPIVKETPIVKESPIIKETPVKTPIIKESPVKETPIVKEIAINKVEDLLIESGNELIMQLDSKKKKREKKLVKEGEVKKQSKEEKKDDIKKRHELGQFYTTSPILHEKLMQFIKNDFDRILEPSVGRGDLILPVKNKYPNIKFDLYEIDKGLDSKVENINYCDFLTAEIYDFYKTIIGNPPFVRTKKGNLAIDFVRKCFGLLEPNGELIFIVPADFFKLTSTSLLINEMMQIGTFTDIFHPKEENLFSHASINVILFRYCKNPKLPKICVYNDVKKKIINNDGLLIFFDELDKNIKKLEDYFNIYVGLVSGKDEVYRNKIGNIDVLVGENSYDKFIYTKVFPSGRKDIDDYLEKSKGLLLERRIRKFNEDNWFEWGAPRNVGVMESQLGKKCIYIYNLTRRDKVAFEGKVGYFGGNLLVMIPIGDVDISLVVNYLNSYDFRKNYLYGGRFKIGHRQLCNATSI